MIDWPRYTCACHGCDKAATMRLISNATMAAEYCNEHLGEWSRALDKLGRRYRVFSLDD